MFEQLIRNEEALVVVCISIVGIVAILVFGIGWTLVSLSKLSAHTRLKQQMLDRGMPASEIEQVLKAGSDELGDKWRQRKDALVRKRQAGLSA